MKWREKIAEVMKAHPKGKPLTKEGSEIPDPVPMAPPIGYKAQPSMFEVVRQMVRDERARVLEEAGYESPDEADDFDVGDDYEPSSPYEHNFDAVVDPGELKRLRDALDVRERELSTADRRPAASGSSGGTAPGPAGEPASPAGRGQPAGPDLSKV